MTIFELMACLLVLAALFSYINHKFLNFPPAVGLMALSLAASFALVLVGIFLPQVEHRAASIIGGIDLNQTLIHGMLGFMLFAAALHTKIEELAARKWPVLTLASVGVAISTIVVALLTWAAMSALGIEIRFIYCLLFGALISPTDPIAVMAILRQAGVPKNMQTKISGESLFNDGVGVVIFLGLLEIATGDVGFDPVRLTGLFIQEAIGGAALGLGLGWLVYRMLRTVDNYQVEVLLSLALVAGGSALADQLHVSGPVAMVLAGLIIGNLGRSYAMSPNTIEHVDTFWELLDEILNAVLFVLIGLEVLALAFTGKMLLIGVIGIPIVLFARLLAVGVPLTFMRRWGRFAPYTIRVLTWGGLRGGISVALALSLPREVKGVVVAERDTIIAITYVVVVFSILVQGLTIGPLTQRWLKQPQASEEEDDYNGDSR